ncbi:unnamed protein product [Urochloa decumbens]|uniref:RING-type E3 ubiquitin transferase n=1 Tax=Urochloa decumbens TaxID=240449 RepID=A0ABC8YX58_9POAL
MGKTQQQSSRKARVESLMAPAKPEVQLEEEDEATAEDAHAPVAVEGPAAGVEITVRMSKARLHCPVCTLPLKPPIFQCLFGHLACGTCRNQLPDTGRCFVCGHVGAYGRSAALEDMVRTTRILCPYDAYGCGSYVTYYAAAEHQHACPHAPCLCSETGCGGFAGTQAALRDHLRDAHSWPVDAVRYGVALQLRVPESDPAQHRRILVAGGEEGDGAVFFLAVGALGDAPLRVVSLVCARPAGAAAAGPRYACRLRATGPADNGCAGGEAESVVAEMAVPSSAAPGEASVEEVASLVVLRRMLHGPSQEMRISVRIDRFV